MMREKNCPNCGNKMEQRDGQEMQGVAVEVNRHYCDPCRKVVTTFEITTQEPLEDAKALLEQ